VSKSTVPYHWSHILSLFVWFLLIITSSFCCVACGSVFSFFSAPITLWYFCFCSALKFFLCSSCCMLYVLGVLFCREGLNSGLHGCKVDTLLLEPHFQSILLWLFWRWSLLNCLPKLFLNCDPPDLSLPIS
jgi:hypothetical protein